MSASLGDIVGAFRRQADFCRVRDAHFTAAAVDASADEIEAGGPLAAFVSRVDGDPGKAALALRVAGACQALVLKGRGGALSAFYETPDKVPPLADLRAAIASLVDCESETFLHFIDRAPQTNEIRRGAALLFAFSEIAAKTGLPLDLYELGASGGLLLSWDQYRYDFGAFGWGGGDAVIRADWQGGAAPDLHPVAIRNRAGCDLHPVDYADPEELLRARAYIWPEQPERRALFDAAVEKARTLDIRLDQANAVDWLEEKLKTSPEGAVRAVYHSVFAVYLSDAEREKLDAILADAGAKATLSQPLAYVSFEPEETENGFEFFVELTLWPSGERKRVAKAHPHGAWVAPL